MFFKKSKLYTLCGTWTHDPKVKSHMCLRLSQTSSFCLIINVVCHSGLTRLSLLHMFRNKSYFQKRCYVGFKSYVLMCLQSEVQDLKKYLILTCIVRTYAPTALYFKIHKVNFECCASVVLFKTFIQRICWIKG